MSTANKLTYLNGTKQAIKQAINEDFEVIDDNTTFREYADEISSNNAKYKDLIPKETTNATNTLDISNSSGLDKALVTQYGNTYQETTTGKNLMDSEWVDRTLNGVTITNNGDGTYTLNGTSTSSIAFSLQSITGGSVAHALIGKIVNNVGKYITISTGYSHNQGCYLQLNLSKQYGGAEQYGFVSSVYTYSNKLISSNESDAVYINFFIGISANASFNNLKIYPMITIQDSEITTAPTPSDFEPYTNGASPNPDYPQEIVNISGKSTLKDVGKNLCGLKDLELMINLSGTVISNSSAKNVIVDTTNISSLYVSGDFSLLSDSALRIGLYNTYPVLGTTGIRSTMYENGALNTTNCNYVLFSFLTTGSSTDVQNSFQIEQGDEQSTYEPYKEQSFDLDLPFELCKIENYKDRIYPLNGKWYLEKKIGKVVLDGSESGWHTSSLSITGYKSYYVDSSVRINQDVFSGKCNYFEFKSYNDWIGLLEATFIETTYQAIGIRVVETLAPTLEDFKTWLSTHNTIAYFVLATPTTEEITESNYPTLYNQLNNIKLFEGINHITMTNESGLDVEFDIEYYKDWKLD